MNTIKYALLMLVCLLALNVQAQLSLGFRGGFTRSCMQHNNVLLVTDATAPVNRFQVSALVYYAPNKYFSFGIEPGFVQRGAGDIEGGDVIFPLGSTENYQSNYIELPLMAKVNVPIYSKLKAFGKLGYGVARAVSAYRYTVIWGSSRPVKTPIDFESNPSYEKWDHGLYGSLGLSFDIGSNQLFVEALFYAGQRDFYRYEITKNHSRHLGIGYLRYF